MDDFVFVGQSVAFNFKFQVSTSLCSMLFSLWICDFRKAHTSISQFRGKPNGTKGSEGSEPKSIQVLLLLIQHGANGLNLLEAQHVVLVEPLLNPAAEAQAISRVHRIGQKNKTLIHRFLVSLSLSLSLTHTHTHTHYLCPASFAQRVWILVASLFSTPCLFLSCFKTSSP
jgi:hypothetical protein